MGEEGKRRGEERERREEKGDESGAYSIEAEFKH